MTAFVLIRCDRTKLAEVGPLVAGLEGVSEVYTTTGDTDYIAIIRVKDMEGLATLVMDELLKIPGIVRTDTHVALRAFSSEDERYRGF